jgi:hypothetical protein
MQWANNTIVPGRARALCPRSWRVGQRQCLSRPTAVPQEDAFEAYVEPPFDAITTVIRKAGLRLTVAAPSFMVMFMTRWSAPGMRPFSSGASPMSLFWLRPLGGFFRVVLDDLWRLLRSLG